MKWLEAYHEHKLKLNLELTTHCNSRCPQCPRTSVKGLHKEPWLQLTSWSLEDFKKYLPLETLDHLQHLTMSGSFGDPGMCKDLLPIVQYVHDNSHTTMSIATNGGMRDESFWWKLGMIAGKRLRVTFAVDGSTQEIHGKYRRGTDLQTVLNNMKAISETEAKVSTFTVLFKHSEDDFENIKKLVTEYGATDIDYIESNRFWQGSSYDFINEDGEKESLEQIENKDAYINKKTHVRKIKDYRIKDQIPFQTNIDCSWQNNNILKVNWDSFITPCCYLGTAMDRFMGGNRSREDTAHLNPALEYMMDNQEKFKLSHNSLEEILNNLWYTDILYDSFINNPMHLCKRFCGKCEE